MNNGRRGCNSSCLPVHRLLENKLPWNVPFRRHSRNGHGQTETCEEFDSECTVILGDPVQQSVSKGARNKKEETCLFIDVLQRPIGVLTVANTMAPHTCLAGILFALDQHLDLT
jgi:hypothetical protein